MRLVVLSTISGLLPAGCTDVGLYQANRPTFEADKVTVSGTVCTDDPRQSNFPVKVLFIIDASSALRADENDPSAFRGRGVADVINLWGKLPNYSFGLIEYGGRPLRRIEEGFTRDTSVLSEQAMSIQASTNPCRPGHCRDMEGALSLASSIITDDILGGNPGEVSRTSYVIVLFAGGPPVPALDRCACRPDEEVEAADWAGCPWEECDPSEDTPLPDVPDTFSQWTLAADVRKYGLDPSQVSGGACSAQCVFPAGGRAGSCEELQLVQLVRDMKAFARANGAAGLQFHTTYLPDKATRAADDPFAPPPCTCGGADCSAAADQARTVRLLSEMAFAGGGGFLQFGAPEAITFQHVDLFTARDPLVIKDLVVSNMNVLSNGRGVKADSDQDGLDDETEQLLQLCASDPDTDGDGLGDAVEVKLASDPLVPDEPIECIDLQAQLRNDVDLCDPAGGQKSWTVFEDIDRDGLNACEERLLGTEDSLFDSDADGLPDKVEFSNGTNYLAIDPLLDADLDGILNREEIRGHTDARSNDAQTQLDLAYRYEEIDEGIRTVITVSQPLNITGVLLKNASAESELGLGFLRFEPGSPPTLSWCGPGDTVQGGACTAFGPPVDISVPTAEGYRIPSNNGNFITVAVDGPTSYPGQPFTDNIVISGAERNCLRFRVRNIKLLQTEAAWFQGPQGPLRGTQGDNTVLIYFAEAPKDAKDSFGIFRVASLALNYQVGPPETRTPKDAELIFTDDDFVIFE